jgi:hypothetical protein
MFTSLSGLPSFLSVSKKFSFALSIFKPPHNDIAAMDAGSVSDILYIAPGVLANKKRMSGAGLKANARLFVAMRGAAWYIPFNR